ncbi:hypothetical protein SAMN05446037_1005135 [Anaerovirgula multivorans]|uniref:ABC-2 type transporter transmembrane domain-containing protein n=1 Tax=Anaerovirgula multivorans TaxID=312168 RepID=A0A239CCF5_9FIRM|nr:ABC transporter permease [Anaerovirgula multivorans]SNS17907.1 hypothetical protein SAMN05446037_1005135 [Anaerovirgula multivorans]
MKSIITTIVREFKLIFRDGITIFLTISPAMLALIFIFVFGSIHESNISLVVDKSMSPDLVAKLESVADIEYVDNLEIMKERVLGVDNIAGVTVENGDIRLIVEGNEGQSFAEMRRKLVSAALDSELIQYTAEKVEPQTSLAYSISMACIFLLALFLGSASLGFSGVYERESGVIRAISVSPMTLGRYVISKIVPSQLLGIIGVSACAFIVGRADALPQVILLALCSIFVSGIIIFLIITFAGNQIAAVGVLKIIMPVFLIAGISAVFVPEKWIFLYYMLPMYWQYAVIDMAISNQEPTFQFLMILVTGFAWLIPVMIVFTKKIKMKVWR